MSKDDGREDPSFCPYGCNDTIRKLQDQITGMKIRLVEQEKERAICHGTFVGELDGRLLPGDFFDATDGACPGWWRGHDNGAEGAMKRTITETEEK